MTSSTGARAWRPALLALFALALLLCAGFVRADHGMPPVVALDAGRPAVDAPPAWVWVGPSGKAGLEDLVSGRVPMKPLVPGQSLRVREGISVWARLRVQPARGQGDNWQLELPLAVMDRVTIHQRGPDGKWLTRTAGDTLPRTAWPQAGRFPFFHLELQEGRPNDVFLHVEHATPLALPLRLVTTTQHYHRSLLEYLALGTLLGGVALLVLMFLARAWTLRDPAYGWSAAYGLVCLLALASFTGVSGHVLWGDTDTWVDVAPGALALLASSMAMLITGKVSGVVTRTVWLGHAVQIVGWSGLLFVPLYMVVERLHGILLMAAYLLGVSALSLYAALVTCRRGDPVGRWMLWGSVPLVLAVGVAVLRSLSIIEAFWLTEYAVAFALTIALPMLLGTLNSRNQERRGAELRQLAAEHQDALTGLLKAKPFMARLTQAIHRFHRRGEGAAVAVIELSNYEWIKKTLGAEAAEECLLRSVIKLRRLVRDVDTTGRIGEKRFGLILEGVQIPRAVNGVASRLIAAGLMDEPGRAKEVDLRFHIAAVLLKDHATGAAEVLDALFRVLETMSPRTNRPFRFYDPLETPGAVDPLEVPTEVMERVVATATAP